MAGNKKSGRKNEAQIKEQCKSEGCKNEAVLMDACADCFNAEYDDNHRPVPKTMGTKTKVNINEDGTKKLCKICKERPAHCQGECAPCYMQVYNGLQRI